MFVLFSSGGTIFIALTGNRIEFERAGGVYRRKADTSAKRAAGTGGTKMLMSYDRESVGLAEAPAATPGKVPGLPSESDVGDLQLTHFPFRSWCRHCVRAKGKESPNHESSPGGVAKFARDNMFSGVDGTPITILVGHDGLREASIANVVPGKGTSHDYTKRDTGHQKSDAAKRPTIKHHGRQTQSWHAHHNRNRPRRTPRRRQQLQRKHHARRANNPRTNSCDQGLHKTTDRCDDGPRQS